MAWQHFEAHVAWVGDMPTAIRSFRKQWAYYSHGLEGASAFRAAVFSLADFKNLREVVHRFFERAKKGKCEAALAVEGPG